MANLKTISAALKLVDTKKDNLRKAFEDLQSHSSSLSSFSLSWPDLDSHFTSLQSTLEHRFNLLQSQIPQSPPPSEPKPPSSSPITVKNSSDPAAIPARPEMKSLCEEMNGLGLRQYIVERTKERNAIRAELPDALRSSPDAPAMVLDAMEGFYVPDSKANNDKELCAIRSGCLILLEELRAMEPEIKPEVTERANNLAVEWKGKVCFGGENPLESLGFLNLLVSYGLVDGFDMDELIEFAVVAASTRYSQTIKLCHNLGFGDRISDLIQKLISKGKQLPAVKFIFEFGLGGKFPPVPLLKDYVKDSKKSAQNVRNDPESNNKSLIGAMMKEISALQLVIKYIEDHKLESEYPKGNLIKRIGKLKKDKVLRKQSRPQKRKPQEDRGSKRPRTNAPAAPAATPSRQLRSQKRKPQDSGSKRPRTTAPAGPAATPSSVAAQGAIARPLQQPHLLPAGLLPKHPALYSSLPAGPYGLAAPTPATGPTPAVPPYGSTPAVPPYQGSSAGLFGFAGSPMGFSVNVIPTGSHQYPSQSHVSSAYSDRPVAYSGYGLPQQFHPSYFPQ